mmetsp:Transcript_9407/g.24220  ORF Transcript_9407/g.24220 Transcript_9407/m.24220 type:complete len:220 (+) Transcript_9407:429-1088(+)
MRVSWLEHISSRTLDIEPSKRSHSSPLRRQSNWEIHPLPPFLKSQIWAALLPHSEPKLHLHEVAAPQEVVVHCLVLPRLDLLPIDGRFDSLCVAAAPRHHEALGDLHVHVQVFLVQPQSCDLRELVHKQLDQLSFVLVHHGGLGANPSVAYAIRHGSCIDAAPIQQSALSGPNLVAPIKSIVDLRVRVLDCVILGDRLCMVLHLLVIHLHLAGLPEDLI